MWLFAFIIAMKNTTEGANVLYKKMQFIAIFDTKNI